MSDYFDEEGEEPGIPAFLSDPVGILRRRWRWMLGAFFLGVIGTAGFISMQHPTYVAKATIAIKRQRIPEDLVRSTVQEDSFQVINALLGEVLSRTKLSALILEHGLYEEQREGMTLDAVIRIMRQHVDVAPEQGLSLRGVEGSRIIAISFEYKDPAVAAAVTNSITHSIVDESLKSRSEQARLTAEFLRNEFTRVERTVREQNRKIADYQRKYRGELPEDIDPNLRRLERLQAQRQSLAIQISEAESRLASIAISMREEPVISDLEQKLSTLREELAEARLLYTSQHPNLMDLERQVTRLEEQLASSDDKGGAETSGSHESLLAATRNEINLLRRQLVEVETEIQVLDNRVAQAPARREELSAMQQTAQVLNENYLEVLRKVKEAELAQSLEMAQHGAQLSIVDSAEPPSEASKKRLKLAVLGVVASLALAGGIGVFLEILDPVLVSENQLQSITNLPCLGIIPRS